jgi:DEAD/DEAH box helicase domain-containing protein
MMTTTELIAESGARVVGCQVLPPSNGVFAPLPPDLPSALATALEAAGITRLYRHQREGIDAIGSGENVLLTTGTASGKSLAYLLPALARQLSDPAATVLALYPTKALAHDQARSLSPLAIGAGLPHDSVASYDGDTPSGQRPQIRARVRSLITNPDMLHAGILPHHTLWRRFLEGLSLVVVDEIHTYRGIFGGHIAGVLRRLLRVARHYGAEPTFVLTSATLGNPCEHARNLTGAPVRHVDADSAPHSERELLLVQPPLLNADLGLRRPPLQEAVGIAQRLVASGKQVLVFAGSRQGAEEAVLGLRERVPGVRSYRSGLLPRERRAIEEELRNGVARAVVSTNALELGVDVGSVDAVVVAGARPPPPSAGIRNPRAGRRPARPVPGAAPPAPVRSRLRACPVRPGPSAHRARSPALRRIRTARAGSRIVRRLRARRVVVAVRAAPAGSPGSHRRRARLLDRAHLPRARRGSAVSRQRSGDSAR